MEPWHPALLVDEHGRPTGDPHFTIFLPAGKKFDPLALLGRMRRYGRLLPVLKLDGNPPRPLNAARLTVDQRGHAILDPATHTVLGMPALNVHRLVHATRTGSR